MFEPEKFNDAIARVETRALPIPFGNSKYQIDGIVAESQTPERAYRNLLLNFEQRFQDLKRASINRRKSENKVAQIKRQIAGESDKLQQEALMLEIEEIVCGWEYENKLAADCIEELKYMQGMIEKLPEYSRDDFEAAENRYFELKHSGKVNLALPEAIKQSTIKLLEES